MKLALSDGSALTESTQVTVTGPAGWNQDEPRVLTVYAKLYGTYFLSTTMAPVAGVYKVSATVAGQTYTATSGQISPASVLKSAVPIAATDDGTQVTVNWSPVDGAATYLHRVYPTLADAAGDRPLVAAANIATQATSVTFPSSALTPNTSYDIGVLAFSAVVDVKKNFSVPTQFNTSNAYIAQPFFRTP
ncbi:hypothetical protein QR90_06885 [Deinococcus radiopugnans]|uniref:Fibronectin type-III domain-containing protein n=1 Tax=Deinococcus radiopugnans TaxID=57497 RepID=A0A0A7KK39_9DEIO|nr:hypothetical protein [Deinococcus radiopugnans]AIZ44893.1 hypothetical protein QR90_06885 [Deinococcus radiopugnans]